MVDALRRIVLVKKRQEDLGDGPIATLSDTLDGDYAAQDARYGSGYTWPIRGIHRSAS